MPLASDAAISQPNQWGIRSLAPVVRKGSYLASFGGLSPGVSLSGGDGQPVYVRDSLLIDMTVDHKTRRDTGSTRSDQIGKVFVVIGQDVRKCLVCEQLFTRRASAEHANVVCYHARHSARKADVASRVF
jgi:hypothetical protein